MSQFNEQLSEEEKIRNSEGPTVLYVDDSHKLYNSVSTVYTKRMADDELFELDPKLSDGMTGTVDKDPECIPRSTLRSPLPNHDLPDIANDKSISVIYRLPELPADYTFPSNLLRGVKADRNALTYEDLQFATFEKSYNNRRGNYNNNRGWTSQIDQTEDYREQWVLTLERCIFFFLTENYSNNQRRNNRNNRGGYGGNRYNGGGGGGGNYNNGGYGGYNNGGYDNYGGYNNGGYGGAGNYGNPYGGYQGGHQGGHQGGYQGQQQYHNQGYGGGGGGYNNQRGGYNNYQGQGRGHYNNSRGGRGGQSQRWSYGNYYNNNSSNNNNNRNY